MKKEAVKAEAVKAAKEVKVAAKDVEVIENDPFFGKTLFGEEEKKMIMKGKLRVDFSTNNKAGLIHETDKDRGAKIVLDNKAGTVKVFTGKYVDVENHCANYPNRAYLRTYGTMKEALTETIKLINSKKDLIPVKEEKAEKVEA